MLHYEGGPTCAVGQGPAALDLAQVAGLQAALCQLISASGRPAEPCLLELWASLQYYSAAAVPLCHTAPLLSWPVCRRSPLLSAGAAHLAWLRVVRHHETWPCSKQEESQCAGGCPSQGEFATTGCGWSEQKDFRRRVLSGMHSGAPHACYNAAGAHLQLECTKHVSLSLLCLVCQGAQVRGAALQALC